MSRRAGALFLAICVGGCGTSTIAPEQAAAIKRVGVISVAAPQFDRIYVGLTSVGNERQSKDIPSWAVDKAYEDQIAAAAQSVVRATVVRASYPDFGHLNDLNGPIDHPLFWDPNWDNVRSLSKTYCDDNLLDAIVFATRERNTDFIGGTNQRVDGAGIYVRRNLAKIYLSARLTVFDCHNAKPLDLHRVIVSSDISPDLANKPIASWKAEDEDALRKALIGLPGSQWAEGLRAMFGQ